MAEKGACTRSWDKKDAEASEYKAIMLEFQSQREELKMLIKTQIGEVHSSLEKIEKQLDCKLERLERLINENRDELKGELNCKVKQIALTWILDNCLPEWIEWK